MDATVAVALLAAHGALGALYLVILGLLAGRRSDQTDALVLVGLAGSLATAAAATLLGIGEGASGTFALAVASTVLALAFDRAIASDEEDEVDHRAMMIEAGRLGARMGRSDPAGEIGR